jgi:sugar fermentation stimulation protein A
VKRPLTGPVAGRDTDRLTPGPDRPPGTGPLLPRTPLFPEALRGTFLDRPNRFVIRCALAGRTVEAYLPNPGRLWELLLPGRIVHLVPRPPGGKACLTHTALAVEREGIPLLLHTHLNNAVAADLIQRRLVPGLEEAKLVRPEVKVGRSRFDFLLEFRGRPFYLEVKSCTLVGRRIAMFPDAVTERGRRHLEELAELGRQGTACGVLFLIHWPQARYFLPDYHTDPAFAGTFAAVRHEIMLKALSLSWQPDLSLAPEVREAAIPWELLAAEARDAGCYLLSLRIPRDRTLRVGSLGERLFPAGFYVYVGSARHNLENRLARHLRKQRQKRWHIDDLKAHADRVKALAIRTGAPLEHELARALARIADGCVDAFGSSDCRCPGHLFHFRSDPLRDPDFIDLLLDFRINRLEACL